MGTHDIEFLSDGVQLRGWLALPPGAPATRHPLVIATHGLRFVVGPFVGDGAVG